MKALALVLTLVATAYLLAGPGCLAFPVQLEEGEELEGVYNIRTLVTKNNAYVILDTEKPGECEYGLDEFEYGSGTPFEHVNKSLQVAKISIEEGKSYRFKIKCVVEGKSGEEDIIFSVSRISFFLLEKLDELRGDAVRFREEKREYEGKLDIVDLDGQIGELEEIIKSAEGAVEANDIEGLRLQISNGIRKVNEIEIGLEIKSIQLSILDSSRYIILIIILFYLLIYLVSSFFVPYCRISRGLQKLREKENELTSLRKNTEMLYFRRSIDEDTFNKMIVKEQEEIVRVRTKISELEARHMELIKEVFRPSSVIDWSLGERIHIRAWLLKKMDKIKCLKRKT